jgi:hypothetical protein
MKTSKKHQNKIDSGLIWDAICITVGFLAVWFINDIRLKLLGLWMMISAIKRK